MSKEIYISSTPHETRLAIVENDELTEIYYERENEYTLAGSIYNGKVTRVLPGMQSSFVDIGLERDAFLYITDFMEEAADTAEFDHSSETQRPARLDAPRGEGQDQGGRDRDNGRNGNERSATYVSERNQEQAAATPAMDMARASEGRGGEFGGRNDRGGRGRGRGRRDRNGNVDRSGGTERSGNGEMTPRFAQTPIAPEEIEQKPIAMVEDSFTSQETSVSELGEGAPGADESRRWRGRRGRRRGRSQQDGLAIPSDQASIGEFLSVARGDLETGADEPTSFEIDGSEPPSIAHTITPMQPQEPIREASSGGQDRSRERGGRGDRAGRGDRGDRDQRPRVPRGFAPSRNLYGVESAAEEETPYGEAVESLSASGAEPEPLILPGESLSKYRKGGEDATVGAPPVPSFATQVALPDTSFKVDPNWDGGAMLPGETLSRYRGGSSPSAAAFSDSGKRESRRPEGRREERGGRQNDRSRGGRRDGRDSSVASRPEAGQVRESEVRSLHAREETEVVPSIVPSLDLQSGGPVSGYAHVEQQSGKIEAHQPDLAHAELPEPTAEAPTMEDEGLARQAGEQVGGEIEQVDLIQQPAAQEAEPTSETPVEQEYEPEGESVSYRVDLAGPSEYRQPSAPAIETEDASLEMSGHSEPEVVDRVEVSEVVVFLDAPDSRHDQETSDAREEMLSGADGGSVAPHEVTHIHATGEMESELPSLDDQLGEEAAAQGFAPGLGDLEEDFIEEEEVETANLQARGEEDFDDLEEEQLEGAADLGTMIREMSLDELTRSDGASLEEEDDFEEDTLEEDGEFAEEQPGVESFAAPHDDQGEEETSHFSTGVQSEVSEVLPSSAESERRARREAGRRGGRERSGNRDGGGRSSRGERSSSSGQTSDSGSSDRGGYSDRSGMGDRARNTGGSSDRDRGRSSGRGGRQSMQVTNLPAISDLLKPGQEILCQIAKEPIAKKGARITSHIALPGRFLVFMPTVSHTGVSRKIESDAERRRLKEILLSEKGEAAGGFIVRTAAEGASEDELRSDLRFLLNLWADIKRRSESSKSPALIYHDLNLVERILRDQVTDNFSAIWVDTETEYERVLRFLQRFQPGLIRRVKLYTKETPLFEQFGITEEINKALRSKVWLKSGGSIVINQTEALVAIDINTGKYVGKTARLEDTIVKTNLDAIPEIVRQIRLRDLGGIIIIDFIDMDERKNRNRVMAALEEELKTDRAPSKILPFNDFGLVAITRKRVKQSLERTLSTTCGVCAGTGMVKSPVTVCNDIYVEMRKMHKHLDRGDVMLRVNPEVVKQLKSTGTHWLQEMEEMCGKTILIKSDPSLHPEQFDIH